MAVITPEIAAFLAGPNSIMVASQDGHLVPEIARGLSLASDPDGTHVTLTLPDVAARRVIEQLRVDGRVAVVLEQPGSHQTLQLKGRALDLRPARADERAAIEAYIASFFGVLAMLGLPPRLTERYIRWPATAVRIAVEAVFEQTPGPGAGEPLRRREDQA